MAAAVSGIGALAFSVWVLVEGALRPGYHPLRHPVSLMSLGPHGWMNVAAIALMALTLLCAAVLLRRGLPAQGPGRTAWVWMVVAADAFGLLAIFPIDPGLDYPPDVAPRRTIPGLIHGLAGTIAFIALAVSAFASARRFAADSYGGWARIGRWLGAVILLGYLAAGTLTGLDQAGVVTSAPGGLAQRIALAAAVRGSFW
ncbi:MAG: DUF998 domain-containing protein [Myxococcaceae bacterium]|nr:DUF998 domain-containing protein [Myxococcaceae bacterium]